MFRLESEDSAARAGVLRTNHADIETPFLMPVATKATAKFITQKEILEIGYNCIMANSFLISLRPGMEIIENAKGLHEFMNWKKGIFTDSGGFQMISPEIYSKSNDKGAFFKSPFDGSKHFLTPEKVMETQNALGSDVAMVLDEMPLAGWEKARVKSAVERTSLWAKRCFESHSNKKQLLFGIVQGEFFPI